jgi:hypothetical protein
MIYSFAIEKIVQTFKRKKVRSSGNLKLPLGFAQVNVTGRDEETSIATPQLNKDTFKHVECFIAVSRILQTFTLISLPLTEKCNDRLNWFAKKIHPSNLLEGLTLAGTYIKYNSNDPSTSLFHCHIDGINSPTSPSNYILIVGMDRFINGRLIRISLIGFARKSVDDFLHRMELFKPVLEAIDHYYIYG